MFGGSAGLVQRFSRLRNVMYDHMQLIVGFLPPGSRAEEPGFRKCGVTHN